MELPNNSVGISDIQDWRECPRRMEFGLKRFTAEGEPPEKMGPSNAYGTIIHDVFHALESEDLTDDEAIQRAFDEHGKWLDPDDLVQLQEDVALYHERDYLGVRLIGSEIEVKAPLAVIEGTQVYYRAKIDRLYQRLDNEGLFIAVDYKSSKWRKTQEDVDNDPQMWAYNFVIHEFFPEVERLIQQYDQLRFGTLTTSKSPAQREQMREWLTRQATAIVHDQEAPPKFNQWCPWCPIMMDCPVPPKLTTYATAEIGALAPMTKEGRKNVVHLDPDLFEVYVEELPNVHTAKLVLERFEENVKRALKDMPAVKRAGLGYSVKERNSTIFGPKAIQALHDEMGDAFYETIKLTKTQIEQALAHDPAMAARILGMADKVRGATVITEDR